jgi:hypothetical protein
MIKQMKTELFYTIELFDDGTLDTCFSVRDDQTHEFTVMRYDSSTFDFMTTEAVFEQVLEDYLGA